MPINKPIIVEYQTGVDVLGFPIYVQHTHQIIKKKWKKRIIEETITGQKIIKQH